MLNVTFSMHCMSILYKRKRAYFTTLTIILIAHELWHFEEKHCVEYANKVGLVKDTCM
jgi:hypothetical protein